MYWEKESILWLVLPWNRWICVNLKVLMSLRIIRNFWRNPSIYELLERNARISKTSISNQISSIKLSSKKICLNSKLIFLDYFECHYFCHNELIATWETNKKSFITYSFHSFQNLICKKKVLYFFSIFHLNAFCVTFIFRLIFSEYFKWRKSSFRALQDFKDSLLIEDVIELNIKSN